MDNEILLKIIVPAITGSLFGGLAGAFFNFISTPVKEFRYALTQLYTDIMYYSSVLHSQRGIGNYQEEARKDIRRSAHNLLAAYIHVYFYDQLATIGCVPKRSLIMRRDNGGDGDGIYYLAIRITNSIGVRLESEPFNQESEDYLKDDIQKIRLLLRQAVECLWGKYGRKNVGW
jgi:hypothetical protein